MECKMLDFFPAYRPMGKSGTLYFPKKAFAGIGGAILVLGAISIVLGGVTLGLSISKIKR